MKHLKKFNESWFDVFKGDKIPMNRVSDDIKDINTEKELQEYLLKANDEEIFDDIINNLDEVMVIDPSSFVYKGISFYFDNNWDRLFYVYSVPKNTNKWYRRYIKSDEYFDELRRLIGKKLNDK